MPLSAIGPAIAAASSAALPAAGAGAAAAGSQFLPAVMNMLKKSSIQFGNDRFGVNLGPSPQRQLKNTLELLQKDDLLGDLLGQNENPIAMSSTTGDRFVNLNTPPRFA